MQLWLCTTRGAVAYGIFGGPRRSSWVSLQFAHCTQPLGGAALGRVRGRLTAMADVSHRGALCCVELKEALAAMAAVHHRGALCHVEFSGAHPAAAAVGHQGALLLRCVGFMALWGWGFWGWGLLGSVCLTGFLASLPTPHPTPRTPPPHPTAPHFAPRAVLVSIGGHGLGKRTARLLHAPQTPPIPHRGTPPPK